MIRVHSPRGVVRLVPEDDDRLVRLIAEVFEAGRSTRHTAAAMEANHRIKDGSTVHHRGWTFEPETTVHHLSGSH